MDQAQAAAKQQIVERVKQANNILVTVSSDPSVDQLAACIGVTLLLNKMDKHATAVFSGKVPSMLEFLQPEKTIESNTDSLRDFIISLDKAKADKLRYKVEDQFVRIYITPYKTSISEKDLVFSEGDFNVEVVLALGVKDKGQLDAAISQHGRILHDATVVSVNSGQEKAAGIGQLNWQDPAASSLCEMLVSISEAFGTGLIDNQMATAFLTGIVAETERFSNPKTSPKVMTMSAQLMAAGANQQLIVSKLEPPEPPPEAAKPVVPFTPPPAAPPAPPSDTLTIPHGEDEPKGVEVDVKKPEEIHIDEKGNIVQPKDPKKDAAQQSGHKWAPQNSFAPLPTPIVTGDVTQPDPMPVTEPTPPQAPETPKVTPLHEEKELASPQPPVVAAPHVDAKPAASPHPHTLLSNSEHRTAALSADTQPGGNQSADEASMDPLGNDHESGYLLGKDNKPATAEPSTGLSSATNVYPEPESASTPTFPTPTVDDARSAVAHAMASAPYNPANEGPTAALNSQPMASDLAKPAPPPVPPPLQFAPKTPAPAPAAPQNPQEAEKLAHSLAKPL